MASAAREPSAGGHDIEVSVVVPCRGHADSLAELLDDLAHQRTVCRFEVLVADAGPDDAVRAVAESHGAMTVRGEAGLLPGQARDLATARARGAVVAFIDADCRPDATWVEAAASALAEEARVVGGPVDDLWPWHPIAVADNLLQFANLPRTRPAGPIHMLPSCNLALRVEDYHALGGFRHSEGVATGEDVAFCERVAARWPAAIRFEPSMAVRHAGRTTIAGLMRHHYRFGYSRGRLRLLLSPRQGRLAGLPVLFPALVLRRLAFVFGRVLRYRPARLPFTLALAPLLVLGSAAWAVGLRSGLAAAPPVTERR
jgi:glycosyltransferase involved in cell wall biosynthesis